MWMRGVYVVCLPDIAAVSERREQSLVAGRSLPMQQEL